MALKTLVDEVTKKTSGSQGDPLSRAEVEKVVHVTLQELRGNPDAQKALLSNAGNSPTLN